MKCDETRPSCNRCKLSLIVCGGYPRPKSLSRVKNLIPRESGINEPLPIPPNISTAFFEDEQQARYFQAFCEMTSVKISGSFDSKLWTQTILQTCYVNHAIRFAVVAIGAFDRILSMKICPRKPRIPLSPLDSQRSNDLYSYALRQYGQSIRKLRDTNFSTNYDIKTALIAIICFVCFETLHGDFESAVSQAHCGLRLLEAQNHGLLHTSWRTYGLSSPIPNPLEDELIQAFGTSKMSTSETDYLLT